MPHLKPPYDARLNKPFLTPILEIVPENDRVKTFTFRYNPIDTPIVMKPGQFLMIWLPGIDEIPMSIASIQPENIVKISVANVGEATAALHALKVGDEIGIRGPYGNNYELQGGTAIIIGGGIGMASILPLIDQAVSNQQDNNCVNIDRLVVIEGAKTESELLFQEYIGNRLSNNCTLDVCTDDGSCGFHGFTTERLDLLLQKELEHQKQSNQDSPITIYACGPEKMLYKVFEICERYNLPVQLSLERMMRCGFGICGLCALEPTGYLVCRDGPIFENDILREVEDFGKIHRDFSGKPYSI